MMSPTTTTSSVTPPTTRKNKRGSTSTTNSTNTQDDAQTPAPKQARRGRPPKIVTPDAPTSSKTSTPMDPQTIALLPQVLQGALLLTPAQAQRDAGVPGCRVAIHQALLKVVKLHESVATLTKDVLPMLLPNQQQQRRRQQIVHMLMIDSVTELIRVQTKQKEALLQLRKLLPIWSPFEQQLLDLMEYKMNHGHLEIPLKSGGTLGQLVSRLRQKYHMHTVVEGYTLEGPTSVSATMGPDHDLFEKKYQGYKWDKTPGRTIALCAQQLRLPW